ncbi:hypothetical protein [Sulfurisphaera javensis]|uniref:hypothetical protein n=1 Tax=Sulfurisphaera javensis TaxID=2049879 RepID=UPI0034E89F22
MKQGYEEEGKEYEEEALTLVAKELNGIPAWLNYYGLISLSCKKIDIKCAKCSLNKM